MRNASDLNAEDKDNCLEQVQMPIFRDFFDGRVDPLGKSSVKNM